MRKSYFLFQYCDIMVEYKMVLLTTGGSLFSLLPSDVLPSEPQEVGEYSLFWAGVRDRRCYKEDKIKLSKNSLTTYELYVLGLAKLH